MAKTKVFTADRLSQLQDDMRFNAHLMIDIYAENEKMPFGNPYDGEYWNIDPDAKQAGRNKGERHSGDNSGIRAFQGSETF